MTRATAPLLKDLNERTVLEMIRGGAPISRAEISRRAGVSKPTVSLALQALAGEGLLQRTSHGTWMLRHDSREALPDVRPIGTIHTAAVNAHRDCDERDGHLTFVAGG